MLRKREEREKLLCKLAFKPSVRRAPVLEKSCSQRTLFSFSHFFSISNSLSVSGRPYFAYIGHFEGYRYYFSAVGTLMHQQNM